MTVPIERTLAAAIDYDAGATRVNQENRLKLMLANARQRENGNAARKKEEIPA